MSDDWMGAKLALFVGDELAVLKRDDAPGLLWADAWDLPGGGREEEDQSPLACVLRETKEELTLDVAPTAIVWGRRYINSIGRGAWFFAGRVPGDRAAELRLGAEGQRWSLMPVGVFLASTCVVPQFQVRLRDYLDGVAGDPY
ncbi:MAG: NUDIX domain-containing protein [Rhodobacteraceae bacterium]|nr:NUDIX domain-containing protein [Paracoccaceae bacterium]